MVCLFVCVCGYGFNAGTGEKKFVATDTGSRVGVGCFHLVLPQ